MGREKGQRVKGNLKPASSGRIAELINTSQTTSPITFSSLAASAGTSQHGAGAAAVFVPIIPDSEETGLDAQLTLTLRKLGKKDPTTKVKALQELLDLCKDDPKLPSLILPYFPRIYCKLSSDDDKKVRELCHNLLASISSSVGRNLAPYTKVLIPTWLISQNDTFPPAASAATNAFQITFLTPEKQIQAIKFCTNEICSLLGEKLSKNTRDPDEEYLGIVGCLETINKLVKMEIELTEDFLGEELLKSDTFWGYGTHESSLVRRKFYNLLASLSQYHAPKIPKSKLTQTLTRAFKEETVEIQSLWNSFLTLTLHGVFNELKVAKTQLLNCCRKGFYGNASRLGPLVLPLVDKIGEVADDELFEALAEGFKNERSINERQSILRTYAEILAYMYKKSGKIPSSVFPFITGDMKLMTEFGKTANSLIKTETFYTELADYCSSPENERVISNPEFGTFLLSFLKSNVKGVQFVDQGDKGSSAYEKLDSSKKHFVQALAKKLIQVQNFHALSVITRWLNSPKFYTDLVDPKTIDSLFVFSDPSQKLEALRTSIDLLRSFPECPASLSLFSTVFESFFNQTQNDLELFVREIEEWDSSVKPLKNWLRMNRFNVELFGSSPTIVKYILRRASLFETDTTSLVIQNLSVNCVENLGLIQDLVQLQLQLESIDLTPVFCATWTAFVDNPTNEKLESVAITICEHGLVPLQFIQDSLNRAVETSRDLESLNNLVSVYHVLGKALMENWESGKLSFEIDGDILVFRGFSFPRLRHVHLGPMQKLEINRHMKSSLFEAKVALEYERLSHLTQVALNLFYLRALIDIYKDTTRGQWHQGHDKEDEDVLFYEEVNIISTRVLEIVAQDSQQWKELNCAMMEACGDAIWDSKYPLELFITTVNKMELPTSITYVSEPNDQALTDIEHLFKTYLIIPSSPTEKLVKMIQAERTDQSEQFYFDTLYSHVPESAKPRLLALLELTMELMAREPGEFLSIGTCWVSAWLKQAKNIHSDKLNYLWVLKLSRAVILIHELSKLHTDFTQEYIEFHTANLFPVIYAHWKQLLDVNAEQEPWKLLVAENVAEAVSLTPKPTANFIEPEPSKIFETFTSTLQRTEIFYKVASYKLMRKFQIQNEIMPKEFEIYFKKLKRAKYTDEVIVSFLLAWDALLYAQPNGYELASYVKEDYLLSNLLSLIFFTLLPENPKTYFDTDPELSPRTIPSISHLSCAVLQHVLRTLPYTVRWWWTSVLTKQRDKVQVEKVVTKYLSAKLAAEELGKVQWDKDGGDGDNVTVNCHPGCNELIARYKIEDTNVTLTITLPLNHPLGPVSAKISDKKLHAKISSLLNTRSHSLAAGLKLWKESLDSVYKDVDECAICFFIVHNTNKQLPKLACKTCKKKFHSACLYKWFSTSNKSECPLCRTIF